MKRFLTFLILVILTACGPIKHLPPAENNHSVEVRDSVRIVDSVRIREATKYRDFAWLGDTLKIDGQRSHMWAVADTTKEAVIGGLEEDKIEEKTRIEYKDREVHDTTYIKEPFPVEVEKVVAPKLYPWSLAFNFLFLAVIGLWIYFKTKMKLKI